MHRISLIPLLLVSSLWSPAAADSVPEIPPSALVLFQQRFDSLRTQYGKLLDPSDSTAGNNDPTLAERLRLTLDSHRSAYHRELLILETDLVTHRHPQGRTRPRSRTGRPLLLRTPPRRLPPPGHPRRRTRTHHRGPQAEATALHADERAAKAIYRHETSLDDLFRRATARQQRDIAKARRSLDRELDSKIIDDDQVADLKAEVAAAEAAIGELHHYFYGFKPGAGFEPNPGWPADHPAETLRSTIRSTRESLLKQARDTDGDGGEESARGGLVGGSYVYSANLGVVLDISGSMTEHIETLKQEIATTFDGPRYREVGNCRLDSSDFTVINRSIRPPHARGNMAVMEELITIHRIDTLYWFTDLRDSRDPQSLRRLRSLLRRGGVAFHVKSMSNRPDRELKPLIDDFQQ
jgi:hypothetical protein